MVLKKIVENPELNCHVIGRLVVVCFDLQALNHFKDGFRRLKRFESPQTSQRDVRIDYTLNVEEEVVK